jgi:hypothetical protein
MSDEPGFLIVGNERSASIQVTGGMEPEQVASGLRNCLVTIYARSGKEMTRDDRTIANIVLGELDQAIAHTARADRHLRRVRWVLYGAAALNISAALWNSLSAMGHH